MPTQQAAQPEALEIFEAVARALDNPQCNLTIYGVDQEALHSIWEQEDRFIDDFNATRNKFTDPEFNLFNSNSRTIHYILKPVEDGTAGFCLWSPVSYSYSPIGEQKRMEQTPTRHGRRISILGLWQPEEGFEYALSQGGLIAPSYLVLSATILKSKFCKFC